MVRKKLAMAVLALSALQADFASALGVGNVAVRSNLNQPLNAEIRLLDTGDLDPSQIKIELASPEDFERAGVDRDYFLSNLRFAVELDGRGGGVVRITTREPVVEPYLNFIVETRWPSGRLLREYAVLLDLPTFSEGASVPFVPAGSSGLATVQQSQQQPRSAAPAPAAPAGDWSMPGGGPGEYRVQQSDTMGKIAARLRPASDVSVEQTMLAIQRANPQAFIRNNVNLVKAGYVLRVPSADEMRSLSAGEATQEVAAQNQAWRSGDSYAPGSADTAAAPQLDARASTTTGEESGHREQSRLSIATPGDSARADAGEGAAASGAGSEALRNELSVAQEGLESAQRDNTELQSRLDAMERQMATLQRLITVKDEQLAALQAQGQQQVAAATEPMTETDESTESALADTEAPVTGEADAPSAEEPVAEETPVAEATVVAQLAPEPAKPTPKPAEPGLVEQLTANPLVPAVGAGALALVLAGVLLARRRKAAEQEQQALNELAFDFEAPVEESTESIATDFESALISDDKVAHADDFIAPVEAPVQRVRSETGDAIAEADIYIAYGRYQQAVDLLKSAIEAEPARSDLRIKLLEVHVEMRDRDAFRRQFSELQALGNDGAVAQVKEMLSSVDGVSGWLDDMPVGMTSAFAPAAAAAVTATAVLAVDEVEPEEAELDLDTELTLDGELSGDELDLDLGDEFAGEELALDDFAVADEPAAADEPALSLNALTELSGLEPVAQPLQTFEAPAVVADSFEMALDESTADDGLELDLNEEELDLALGDIGGDGDGLEDLALDFADGSVATPVNAVDDEFDLGALDEPVTHESLELAADLDLTEPVPESTDALANLEADFGSLDDLDLQPQNTAPAWSAEPVATSEPFEPDVFANGGTFQGGETIQGGDTFQSTETFANAETFEGMETFQGPDTFENAESAAAAFASDEFSADAMAAEVATDAPVLEGGDDEFDFLADADEVATKLDLARAYIDMGDTDGARDILGEVMQEGTEAQRQDAGALLSRIG